MTAISQSVRYTAPESAFTLPPELQELKLLAREIVDRECIPLEGEFLSDRYADAQGVNHGQYEIDGVTPDVVASHVIETLNDAFVRPV